MQASAQAQPNIALVKYWGKRDIASNLPAVSSLSITLDSLWTRMSVEFCDQGADTLEVNGAAADAMLPRVTHCLDLVAGSGRQAARVTSSSNFPIAAGLASSASAFAALTVAADKAANAGLDTLTLARLAGSCSGSAARSLYGGIVALTAGEDQIDLTELADEDAWPLQVIVAITEETEKAVGSGEAMKRSAASSPFYASWLAQQAADIDAATTAVQRRDFALLGRTAEHNCLKMHSVMWTSRPALVYWNSATLSCMEAIRSMRETGIAVFFTIDAGPQVKAVCLPGDADAVEETLRQVPGVRRTLRSGLGAGARVIEP